MTDLSPAAQAVKDAAIDVYWLFHPAQAAALIRAAAKQVDGQWDPVEELLAIAAELANTSPPS